MKYEVYLYLKNHPPALELFKKLEGVGNLYLIGGVLREYIDHKKIIHLRDIDIIVDVKDYLLWKEILSQYMKRHNRFGGYKLECCGLIIDIWAIEETWAYRSGSIQCPPQDYFKFLPDTVFLNIDSIVYDWKKNVWLYEKYREAMRTRVIDVVLVNNPQLQLNIIRALVLKKRYTMDFSKKLDSIICNEANNYSSILQFSETLFDEQMRRYNDAILTKEEIREELSRASSIANAQP